MGRESEPGMFRGRMRQLGRGVGWGKSHLINSSFSSSYNKEEVKFVTRSSKYVYTYTAVKDASVHKLQKSYGYEVVSSLRGLEEWHGRWKTDEPGDRYQHKGDQSDWYGHSLPRRYKQPYQEEQRVQAITNIQLSKISAINRSKIRSRRT